MAKTVRPILCPQCGSPQHTPLGPGSFRCAACQTEYFLDSDDVTVNVQHHYAPAGAPPPLSWGQRVAIGLCGLVGVGAVVWLVLLAARLRQPNRENVVVVKPFPRLILLLDKHRLTDGEVATFRTWLAACQNG